MKIQVKVIPNAKKESLEIVDGEYRARVSAPPVDGKANEQLIEILAEHFGVSKSKIRIKNPTSRHKLVEIEGI